MRAYPIPFMKNNYLTTYTLQAGDTLLDLSRPIVMGIANITPDSFYSGSRVDSANSLLTRARQIIDEGGVIMDIGACSTRPGALLVDSTEEEKRLRPALKLLRQEFPHLLISVDTYRADIARMCVEEYGVNFINDISGGLADKEMLSTAAQLPVAYILMHLHKGVEEMHQTPSYPDGVEVAVVDFFIQQVERLRSLGAKDVVLDPGYGFSKTLEENYRLMILQRKAFESLQLPILVGISRKRMIQQVVQCTAEEALNGTTALHTFFLLQGMTHIIRTHDVKAAVEAICITQKIEEVTRGIPPQGHIERLEVSRITKSHD